MRRIRRPYRGIATADLEAFAARMLDDGSDGAIALAIAVDTAARGRLA